MMQVRLGAGLSRWACTVCGEIFGWGPGASMLRAPTNCPACDQMEGLVPLVEVADAEQA